MADQALTNRETRELGVEYERLTLHQRLQHMVLIFAFVLLLVTGFPLRYPEATASGAVLRALGGSGARAVLHRFGAVLLIGLCVYHLGYVLFSRRGHDEFLALTPRPKDARDLLRMLRFYLGLAPSKPRFGRFNYIEKFEYLAMGWGSVIMILTGLMLWFHDFTLAFLPKWVWDVTKVVHSWEAVLAFLAIIIWHMYNVHLNPSAFPMSKIWLTGKITEKELRGEHPLEYEQIVARSRPEDGRVS